MSYRKRGASLDGCRRSSNLKRFGLRRQVAHLKCCRRPLITTTAGAVGERIETGDSLATLTE